MDYAEVSVIVGVLKLLSVNRRWIVPNLGINELAIVVQITLGLLLPVAALYFIIRQAVLSALRKFYRELDEAGGKNKLNATI